MLTIKSFLVIQFLFWSRKHKKFSFSLRKLINFPFRENTFLSPIHADSNHVAGYLWNS